MCGLVSGKGSSTPSQSKSMCPPGGSVAPGKICRFVVAVGRSREAREAVAIAVKRDQPGCGRRGGFDVSGGVDCSDGEDVVALPRFRYVCGDEQRVKPPLSSWHWKVTKFSDAENEKLADVGPRLTTFGADAEVMVAIGGLVSRNSVTGSPTLSTSAARSELPAGAGRTSRRHPRGRSSGWASRLAPWDSRYVRCRRPRGRYSILRWWPPKDRR